uniref:Reverse transcriptase domain-containing protein n=1 Tax=Trichobilharzia regenti TaxID=157069 RepID=A0AA85JBV2_TRIRE
MYNHTLLSCKSPISLWKLFNEITGNSKRCNVFPSYDVNALNLSVIRSPSTITTSNVTNLVADNFHDFNTLHLLKCLKTLKPSRSLGPDGVLAYVLKQCADALCSPLTNILNASFSENVVPVPWKDIKIVPVPKPGNRKNVKFRPIAITSPFLKLMEKLVLLKLEPSLKSFKDPKQFAYSQGRSTLDAAAVLHNSIVSSLDKGAKYVRCTFLDFTSAFDSAP